MSGASKAANFKTSDHRTRDCQAGWTTAGVVRKPFPLLLEEHACCRLDTPLKACEKLEIAFRFVKCVQVPEATFLQHFLPEPLETPLDGLGIHTVCHS